MRPISEYYFVVPRNNKFRDYMYERYINEETSDGSPFCKLTHGYLVTADQMENVTNDMWFEAYKIKSDRFSDKDDFVQCFWDGDCTDDDFELIMSVCH